MNDAKRHYKARGAAAQIWSDRSPEVFLSGPAGTGKSRACLEKLHGCMLRWPGARALIVRKTRESLTESALVTFEEKVLPEGSPIKEGPQRRMRQAYHYPNGSEVVIGGLDKPSKVMSTEYDLIYVQEAIELYENDHESLTTRLRNGVMPFQQIMGDTNPDSPQHWFYRRSQSGSLKMLESRHEDNPVLYDAAKAQWTAAGVTYLATLDRLTGPRKDRLRHGKWVQAEGVVYPEFDRAVHLIDSFAIPPEWRRIRAIDFGYANPFVCLWIAINPDERAYVYRELYMTQQTVRSHAKRIKTLSAGERFTYTVADHDAEDRATLMEEGISTIPARKMTSPGREALAEMLRPRGDGKPGILFFRDCLTERDARLAEAKRPVSIIEEFDSYVWPKGQDGKAIKEEPVKEFDHGLDALRYAVMAMSQPRSGSASVGGMLPPIAQSPFGVRR